MRRSTHLSLVTLVVLGMGLLVSCSDDPTAPNLLASIDAPNGGDLIAPGATVDVKWTSPSPGKVASVALSYTDDSQKGAFTKLAENLAPTGTYAWTVPPKTLYGVKVRVEATATGGSVTKDLSDQSFAIVKSSPRGYVTSTVCGDCHEANYDAVMKSGHPYKINKVVNNQPPTYPYTTVPTPPIGVTWNTVSYVIGGYGWKARFMDPNGFIYVTGVLGTEVQYNLPAPAVGLTGTSWSNYHGSDTVPKPYDCGKCHTTGWQTFAENGGVHQDGLEGIVGTWEEPGIMCEACHGAGGTHVATQERADITVDKTSELCGSCHTRDAQRRVEASGGFIRHHEQYDEMISAGHKDRQCVDCHDPHIGVKYGHADAGGIVKDCDSAGCHAGRTVKHSAVAECKDCHMARFSKSARAANKYTGDLRTHIFEIDASKTNKDDMFYEADGKTFASGFLSLDVVCYQCHLDPDDIGGATMQGAPKLSMATLAARADGIHDAP